MVIAQNAWRRLGVQVEILELEWAVFIRERVNKLDFDAVVLGWAMGLDADIYQLFHSSQTGSPAAQLRRLRGTRRRTTLMVRIRREYDDARQTAMARELHRLIAHDQPYTFLYVRRALALMDGEDRPRGAAPGRHVPLPAVRAEPPGPHQLPLQPVAQDARAGPAPLPARADPD